MATLHVRDLMTPDVHVVRPDDSIATLRDLMHEKHVRHVPVVDDDDRLVGLVSERDLLRRAAGLEGDVPLSVSDDISTSARVREVMTWHVETIEADDDVATAAAVMLDNKYGCLPVLEQGRAGRDPDRSGFRAARRGACGRRRSAARPRAFEGLRRDGVEQHS